MRAWLMTNTFYGTWLPGDKRGSVTSVRDKREDDAACEVRFEHDMPGTPWEDEKPGLFRAAQAQMKGPPIYFDLENAGSRDATHCWNVLLGLLQTHGDTQARTLFDTLCTVVAKHNRTAGSLDLATVRAELPSDVALKDQPHYGNDLKRLRRHSMTTLTAISHTIGLRVQLPRTQTVEQIAENVQRKDIVVIAGEPMVGKSGLLKLLATTHKLDTAGR